MIVAILSDGSEVTLDRRYGSDVAAFHKQLRAEVLTGSAVALADRELDTAAGGTVPYANVNTFESRQSF